MTTLFLNKVRGIEFIDLVDTLFTIPDRINLVKLVIFLNLLEKLLFNFLWIKNNIFSCLITLKFVWKVNLWWNLLKILKFLLQVLQINLIIQLAWHRNYDKADWFKAGYNNLVDSFLKILRFSICDQNANFVEQLMVNLFVIYKLNHFFKMSGAWEVEKLKLLFVSWNGCGMSRLCYHKLYTMLGKLFFIQLSIHGILFQLLSSKSYGGYHVIPGC